VNTNKRASLLALGLVTLLIGVADLALCWANTPARVDGGRDLSPFCYYGSVAIGLGVCVLLHYRWAIIMCCVLYAGLGMWLIIGSLGRVPFPWVLINAGLGAVCLVPMALLVTSCRKPRSEG